MYFYHLPAFDPRTGINTHKFNKHPFISSIDGLFEPNRDSFKPEQSFPFHRIEIDENRFFFLSEPNLLKVFKNPFLGENPILIENNNPIKKEYTTELLEKFYSGYTAGLEGFEGELGITFSTLTLSQKKEVLNDFMQYCHENLYFEGFAIPEVIYSLGYIQASLVLAYKEYYNLQLIRTAELTPLTASSAQEALLHPEVQVDAENKSEQSRILLKHPVKDVIDLWNILLDPDISHILQAPQAFHTEDQIQELLGSMFKSSSDQQENLPEMELRYLELAPNYQHLLSLLMHAAYKLNDKYQRVPLKEYCELLMLGFSPFSGIKAVKDLESNISKKRDIALEAVKNSQGEYAKKAYQILKKIPSYRLKD